MTRNEQEYYRNIERIAKALEKKSFGKGQKRFEKKYFLALAKAF